MVVPNNGELKGKDNENEMDATSWRFSRLVLVEDLGILQGILGLHEDMHGNSGESNARKMKYQVENGFRV